ncbi:hypothetical protein HanRHA438_Chr06g0270511 [Helianthus annuus]|nr:hypothetical protein HanRHA438_Chr06g0270511 [Helianthus annuus]
MEPFPILWPIYKLLLLIGCFKRRLKKSALFYLHHQTSKFKHRCKVARYLKATLVTSDISGSQHEPGDSRNFGDIQWDV